MKAMGAPLTKAILFAVFLTGCTGGTGEISYFDDREKLTVLQEVLEAGEPGTAAEWSGTQGATGVIEIVGDVSPVSVGVEQAVTCRHVRLTVNPAPREPTTFLPVVGDVRPIVDNAFYCRAPLGFWVSPDEPFFLQVPASVKFGGPGGNIDAPEDTDRDAGGTVSSTRDSRECTRFFREADELEREGRLSEAGRARRDGRRCLTRIN